MISIVYIYEILMSLRTRFVINTKAPSKLQREKFENAAKG